MSNLIYETFSKDGNFIFYGYPDSGTSLVLLQLAANLCKNKLAYNVVSCDNHLKNDLFLEKCTNILDIKFEFMEYDKITKIKTEGLGNLIYLRGYNDCSNIKEYYDLFHNNTLKLILVIDCSRKDDINRELLESVEIINIDHIILSKADMLKNMSGREYLKELCPDISRKLLFISANERIGGDL